MGCDIHIVVEVRRNQEWQCVTEDIFPLDDDDQRHYQRTHGSVCFPTRSYRVFGFLADVRNYSAIPPLSPPKGVPADLSRSVRQTATRYDSGCHSASWLTLAELLTPDYDADVWNRRYTRQQGPNFFNGAATAELHETHLGTREPLRAFLGAEFMTHLDVLKTLGAPPDVRVVFWFDN